MKDYMSYAYKEAKKAFRNKEVPVGAVIVKNDKIIAKARNNRQKKHFVLGHAEILAIIKAGKKIKDWRLDECEMYVTLAPCEMCKTIIKESRIKKVHYLISQPNIIENDVIRTQTNVREEIKNNYLDILNKFFSNLRK